MAAWPDAGPQSAPSACLPIAGSPKGSHVTLLTPAKQRPTRVPHPGWPDRTVAALGIGQVPRPRKERRGGAPAWGPRGAHEAAAPAGERPSQTPWGRTHRGVRQCPRCPPPGPEPVPQPSPGWKATPSLAQSVGPREEQTDERGRRGHPEPPLAQAPGRDRFREDRVVPGVPCGWPDTALDAGLRRPSCPRPRVRGPLPHPARRPGDAGARPGLARAHCPPCSRPRRTAARGPREFPHWARDGAGSPAGPTARPGTRWPGRGHQGLATRCSEV